MPGSKIGEKSKVQIPFPEIVCKLEIIEPLFSPRTVPKSRKVKRVAATPIDTNKTKIIGRSVKSPMLSRFLEIRYPTKVRIRAHLPNGESDEGERSNIKPPMKPRTIAPS